MKTVNALLAVLAIAFTIAAAPTAITEEVMAFGEGGQIKMLYHHRQRPQSICFGDELYIVFNGGAPAGSPSKTPTYPMAIACNLAERTFSPPITLGPSAKDHHFGPVIWADENQFLHVLHGCHKTPGTHLIFKAPATIGDSMEDWEVGPEIAPGISYPSIFTLPNGQELISYRTDGHSSSWTYRLSDDNGKTWQAPPRDVTDLDSKGRTEWSAYQTRMPSKDGRYLHIVFMSYDDVKSNDPARLYNPRYDKVVTNEWKYNLYYIRIDLQTQAVTNFDGEPMATPIDLDQADAKCRIRDTGWRGAGVPPAMLLDENGDPSFLHVLSEDTIEDHRYYYVRRENGAWKETPITHANHQWNNTHLSRDAGGTLHAFLITGDGYFHSDGYMDSHGGGAIEEWVSDDKGNTWSRRRNVTDAAQYPGWRFNNIQPVPRPDGSFVPGMLLFYGWKDKAEVAQLISLQPRPLRLLDVLLAQNCL